MTGFLPALPASGPSARRAGRNSFLRSGLPSAVRTLLITAIPILGCPGTPALAASADPFAIEQLTPGHPGSHGRGPEAAAQDVCAQDLPTSPLSLRDVVDLALCRNLQTREAWAAARARAADIGIVRATYLPSLIADVSARRNEVDSAGIARTGETTYRAEAAISWLLYDFGARDANLENARQLLAAASAAQDNAVQAVFFSALQSFYGVHAREAALSATIEAERSSQQALTAATVRQEVGTATPLDRLQAQTNHSQAVLDRIRAQGDLQAARGVLANVLALSPVQPLVLATIRDAPPDDANASTPENAEASAQVADIGRLIEEASRRRPDLLAAEAEVRAAEAAIAAARATGRPTVSLAASAGVQDSSLGPATRSGSIGVNLTIPLFLGYEPTYRLRAAEARADAQVALRDRIRLQVSLDVWRNYQALVTATQAVRTSRDVVTSAEQAERVALGRYKAGVGNILDVLNAQTALARSRQQAIQATFDRNIARAALAQSTGGLDFDLLTRMNDTQLSPAPTQSGDPTR